METEGQARRDSPNPSTEVPPLAPEPAVARLPLSPMRARSVLRPGLLFPLLVLLATALVSYLPASPPGVFLLTLARTSPSLLAPISTHWQSLELPAPRGFEHAFNLGVAEAQLAEAVAGGRPLPPALEASVRGLLGAAAPPPLAGAETLRSAVLALRAGAVAADAASRGSLLSRTFSVVNVMWLLGILGVCLTVRFVVARFAAWLYDALRRAYVVVVRPLLLVAWKPLACITAASVLLRCGDADVSVDVRVFSCLSAALLAWAPLAADLSEYLLLNEEQGQRQDNRLSWQRVRAPRPPLSLARGTEFT